MDPKSAYLQGQIETSSPSQQVVMLYDGLIRFCNEAKQSLSGENGDQLEAGAQSVKRATDILTELNSALRHDVFPELCTQLSGLYLFFTEQLSKAVRENSAKPIQEILPMIENLRDSWKQAEEKFQESNKGE
ncbi:MAG: flagellar export chaperone FliS [Verrucomicrobiota bacterium]